MSYRSQRFNDDMLSLDAIQFADPAKDPIFSDRGAGAERMFDLLENAESPRETPIDDELLNETMLLAVSVLLANTNRGHLVPTLLAIARNRSNRERSIRELSIREKCKLPAARRRYNRHRGELLKIFIPSNGIKG